MILLSIFVSVQPSTSNSQTLDLVFSALADPTRRAILQSVRGKSHTVAEIAQQFDMSLPAVSKHLKILTVAQLLQREKQGKYIMCTYNPAPCRQALKWINEQQQFWNDSFDALGKFLDNEK